MKTKRGTVHSVLKPFTLYCTSNIRLLVSEGFLTKAVPYKNIANIFGVDKKIIESHEFGKITDDSLLGIME